MIKKKQLKSRKACKLTFELPASFEAEAVQLLAEFNEWREVSIPRLKNGKWKLSQEVEPGRDYQFRYRVVHPSYSDYLNDDAADYTVANGHGGENAVIRC